MPAPDLKQLGLELKGKVSIHGDLQFERPAILWNGVSLNRCRIGAYSYIAPNTNALLTSIGRYCSIGDNVRLGLTQHPVDHLLTSPISYKGVFDWHQAYTPPDTWDELRPLEIQHDVWIGAGATVLSGICVGTGAIIASRAVVTRDVPPYAVVAGIPARTVKLRFAHDMIERLLLLKLWQYDLPKWWAQTTSPLRGTLTDEALATLEQAAADGEVPKYDAKPLTLRKQNHGWAVE